MGTHFVEGSGCLADDCTAGGIDDELSCGLPDGSVGECCGGVCETFTALSSDPSNCAFCGFACPPGAKCAEATCSLSDGGRGDCGSSLPCGNGQACVKPEYSSFAYCVTADCADAGEGVTCLLPETASREVGLCCGGACVDVTSDGANCDGCGFACAGGELCADGACVAAPPCADGGTGLCLLSSGSEGSCCAGSCVDWLNDPANCGGCGLLCPAGAGCLHGRCYLTSCTGGSILPCRFADGGFGTCCNGVCNLFLATDSDCGYCGFGCPTGSSCVYPGAEYPGPCGGDGGLPACQSDAQCPAGDSCVSVYWNQCPIGASCDGSVRACAPTSCAGRPDGTGCTGGLCCGGTCVDPLWAPADCGTCGNSCPAGDSCVEGQCRPGSGCPSSPFCAADAGVPGYCCGAICVGPDDPQNCGQCGLVCPTGTSCYGGICSSANDVEGRCGTGYDASSCPAGSACFESQCFSEVCPAASGWAGHCALGGNAGLGSCCGGACVELPPGQVSCGACDN